MSPRPSSRVSVFLLPALITVVTLTLFLVEPPSGTAVTGTAVADCADASCDPHDDLSMTPSPASEPLDADRIRMAWKTYRYYRRLCDAPATRRAWPAQRAAALYAYRVVRMEITPAGIRRSGLPGL